MPAFFMQDSAVVELVNAILAEAVHAPPESAEAPLVVYFEYKEFDKEQVFVKHCGACHRVLTTLFGGIGNGNTGPNLSGLFSEYYPRTCQDNKEWSPGLLRK